MSTEALAERFGVNLKRCRRRAELNQTELGELASLSRQAIGLIELGHRKPYLESFVGLAVALDVEVGALLDGIGWVVAQQGSPGSFLVDPPSRQFFYSTQRPRTSSLPASKASAVLE
jgi:transcriptional regulator with XRE-family HTH domain